MLILFARRTGLGEFSRQNTPTMFRQRLKLSMFSKKGKTNDAPSSKFTRNDDDVDVDNLNDRIVDALRRSVDLLGPVKPYDVRNASLRSDLGRTLLARLDTAAIGAASPSSQVENESAVALDRDRATVILVELLNDTSRLVVADNSVAVTATTAVNNGRIHLAKLSRFLRTVERKGEIALSGETTNETNDLYDALGQVPADVERFFSSDMTRARDCALRAKVFDERIAPLVDWLSKDSVE